MFGDLSRGYHSVSDLPSMSRSHLKGDFIEQLPPLGALPRLSMDLGYHCQEGQCRQEEESGAE